MAKRSTALSFEAVRRIAAGIDGIEEGVAWGVPALKRHGRLLACMASNKAAEPNTLVVVISFEQRDAMIEDDPDTYYLKPHYEGYPSVLVRLSRVARPALADLLQTACRYADATEKTKRRKPAVRRSRTRSGSRISS
jgi:hypothetical protein